MSGSPQKWDDFFHVFSRDCILSLHLVVCLPALSIILPWLLLLQVWGSKLNNIYMKQECTSTTSLSSIKEKQNKKIVQLLYHWYKAIEFSQKQTEFTWIQTELLSPAKSVFLTMFLESPSSALFSYVFHLTFFLESQFLLAQLNLISMKMMHTHSTAVLLTFL